MASEPRLTRRGDAPRAGIVHLGPGAFFRAFNAVYTDDAIAATGGDWGIVAVSLQSPTARDLLEPQGFAYTAVERGAQGDRPRVINAIVDVMVAPEDPLAVIDQLADPDIHVVTLTITEKGYGYDPATGGLDPTHPGIAADLADQNYPKTAVGFLTAALGLRRMAGTPPFTVLSCDNLPSNGKVTARVVRDFTRRVNPELADWIADTVAFPSTMVDRITPATTPDDIQALARVTGTHDPAAVFHEPFRQWVIEDRFTGPRPGWEAAGAQFVTSVEAHETMKLRCLNGTHSALAYLGYLAGFETIAEATADPDLAALCETLWKDEILPTVPPPEGEDLPAYCRSLMERYRNPAIRHRTWQIAMDGSQKLPQRILGTIADNLAAGRDCPGLCLAVAAWMRYVGGRDEAGAPIDVRDPMADRLRAAHEAAATSQEAVSNLLAIEEIFDPDLASAPRFRDTVLSTYSTLLTQGARATVRDLLATR